MTDMYTIHCPETGSSSGPWTLPEVAEVLATVHAVFEHEGAHTIELIEVFEVPEPTEVTLTNLKKAVAGGPL